MDVSRELTEALAAAELAARYLRAEYDAFAVIPDAPSHISTHADRGAQEIILQHLHARFPDDALCAEEATASARLSAANADRTWVVDPIDGTRGFARKTGEFSVMIALTVGGRPVVGVVAEPVPRRVTWAFAQGGCWVQAEGGEAKRCKVADCTTLAAATLTQSHGKPGKPPKPVVRALQPGRVIETYSAGIKLAQVARGEADLYVNDYPEFHDWDVCAGDVLVTEAGGRVTEYDGRPVRYGLGGAKRQSGLIATNGTLHAAVVAKLGGQVSGDPAG